MQLELKAIITVSMILFAVIDIIGSIPVIIQIRQQTGSIHPEKATLVSFFIMLLFLFLGESILKFLGIDLSSFAIAGALVIFFLSCPFLYPIQVIGLQGKLFNLNNHSCYAGFL